jgi:hypothetical protein
MNQLGSLGGGTKNHVARSGSWMSCWDMGTRYCKTWFSTGTKQAITEHKFLYHCAAFMNVVLPWRCLDSRRLKGP